MTSIHKASSVALLVLMTSLAAMPAAFAQASAPQPAPQAAPAQPAHTLPEADRQAIIQYNLTDDNFNRLVAATKEARAQNIKPSESAVDPSKVHSLDDLAGQVTASDPRIGPLIKKNGFTPREFLLVNLAISNAAMAIQARSNPEQAKYIDQSKVNAANVAFVESHRQQIADLMKQAQQ
ncbi:hypothetical protein [Pinirhizobacter sp.]|jgi:hypothetical protein|uniref:hypothetical protein n=1 Tax=Pinirhizobacter sp. TaxID=2950432 RepID=UPI002F3EBC61